MTYLHRKCRGRRWRCRRRGPARGRRRHAQEGRRGELQLSAPGARGLDQGRRGHARHRDGLHQEPRRGQHSRHCRHRAERSERPAEVPHPQMRLFGGKAFRRAICPLRRGSRESEVSVVVARLGNSQWPQGRSWVATGAHSIAHLLAAIMRFVCAVYHKQSMPASSS